MFARFSASEPSHASPLGADSAIPVSQTKKRTLGAGAMISNQVELKGSLSFEGHLEFNGILEGEILSDGTLFIGPDAVIKGDVAASKVILEGKVHGNITATEAVEVRDQAQLFGDVRSGKFIIAEGATFRGRSEPLEGKAASPDFLPTFRHLIPKLA